MRQLSSGQHPYIAPTDPRVWQALAQKRLMLTPMIVGELKSWLSGPKENLGVHRQITARLNGDETVPVDLYAIADSPDSERLRAFTYYVNLIGWRKRWFARYC